MVKKIHILSLLLLLQVVAFSQSRIPNDSDNYLQVISRMQDGARDRVNVVFFEVPDTLTSTLFFAIRDPEANNSGVDQTSGTNKTDFYLIGGTGTLSNPASRKGVYTDTEVSTNKAHLIGNLLAQYTYDNTFTAVSGPNISADGDWVYFPGVNPSQGEHIGNKYYFKVVTEAENVAIYMKNGYQLDVSITNSGIPTGMSNVRAFAYSWTLNFLDRIGYTWNIHPFVPDNATDSIVYHNYDMDDGEGLEAFNVSGISQGTITPSSTTVDAPQSFFLGTEVGGTWKLVVTEGDGPEPVNNTAEVWFTNDVSGEVYRIYSQQYIPPAADHIALVHEDGIAISDGTDTEQVILQVVGSDDTPLPYSYMIYVQADNSGLIKTINGSPTGGVTAAYVTTDSAGLATITVSDIVAELVTVSVSTNGSTAPGTNAGETLLPGTNDTITIEFKTNPEPTLSADSNMTFVEIDTGTDLDLPTLTITEVGPASITSAANSLIVRIPSSLSAEFDTGFSPTFGGTEAPVSGSTLYTDRLEITPAANFDAGDTLSIGGLRFKETTDSPSSGSLELSYNGGIDYNVIDDKIITIQDSNPTYIWDGSTDTIWTDGTNWVGGSAPGVGGNVIIPSSGVTNFPILNVATDLSSITIANGASLDLDGQNLTVSGAFNNDGTLLANGDETLTLTGGMDIDSGLVYFDGTNPAYASLANLTSFYNIEIAQGGTTWTPTAALTIYGDLTLSAGTLAAGANSVFLSGDIIRTSGSFTSSGTLIFSGSTTQVFNPAGSTLGTIEINQSTPSTVSPSGALAVTGLTLTSGTLVMNANTLSISGDLTKTSGKLTSTGTVTFNGTGAQAFNPTGSTFMNIIINNTGPGTITASDALSIKNLTLTSGTLAMGSNTLTITGDWAGTSGGFTSSGLTSFTGTGTQAFNSAGSTLKDLTIDGTGPVNLGGVLDVTGTLTLTSGTLAAGAYGVSVAGDFDRTSGSFTSTGTLTFDGTAAQDFNPAGSSLTTLTITNTAGTITLLNNLSCTNLSIPANTSFDVNGHVLSVDTTFNTANGGILYRTGTAGESAPQDNDTGRVVYRGTSVGTIENYGTNPDYYDLEIAGTSPFSLSSATEVKRDVIISGGTFDLAGKVLTIHRNFDNSAGATFTHSSGEVIFVDNAVISQVLGNNTFYKFTCIVPGKTIKFATGDTTTFASGGTFRIIGDSISNVHLYSTTSTVTWLLNIPDNANILMQYVDVHDSDATANPIIVLPNVDATDNCPGWVTALNIQSSWTVDSNFNGKIDSLAIQVQGGVSLNDDFSDITVMVNGYTISGSPYTGPVSPGADDNDDIFYVNLAEKPYLDTDAVPSWYIQTNTTLMDNLTNTELVTSAPGPGGELPLDQAAPLIGYTLAMADKNEIFIHFSEPVEKNGTGIIDITDFTYNGLTNVTGVTRISSSGNGTEEVLLSLDGNVSATEIVAAQTITFSNLQDMAGTPNTLVNTTHRVSDVGLGSNGNGIVEPLWAQDGTLRDSARGGIGYISNFEGESWLRDQDLTLQAYIHSDIAGTGLAVTLHFDANIPNSKKSDNFWLPAFNTTSYNGIVPGFNLEPRQRVGTEVSSQLRNFTIPESDSEVTGGKTIEMIFELNGSSLYCARVDNSDASDWYRNLRPWSFQIQDMVNQKSNISILNNVINPDRGEAANLHYILKRSGTVIITVFDLKGDIVDILYRGRKGSGDYSTSWNGKNRGNRTVSRGIYLVKIMGPDIDEVRKILIVK